jgi:hypothetical protein
VKGINIGLNPGAGSGRGHSRTSALSLVPRWTGDSSFMAVFDEVRTMPEHVSRTYAALKPYFTNGAANGKQDRAASTPGQEGCGS